MYTGGTVDAVVYEARDMHELNSATSSIRIPKRGMWINIIAQTDSGCFMFNAEVPRVVDSSEMQDVYGSLESQINTQLNIRDIDAEDAVITTFTRVYTFDGRLEDPEAYRPIYRTDFRKSLSRLSVAKDKPAMHMLMGILAFTEAYQK